VLKVHSLWILQFPFFLKMNNILVYVYTTFSLSIHPSVGMQATSFFIKVNNVAVNMSVHISLQHSAFNYSGYMSKSKSYGPSCNLNCNLLWNCHTIFRSDCAISYSHQQHVSVFSFFIFLPILAVFLGGEVV
jgi:hypothetical protein